MWARSRFRGRYAAPRAVRLMNTTRSVDPHMRKAENRRFLRGLATVPQRRGRGSNSPVLRLIWRPVRETTDRCTAHGDAQPDGVTPRRSGTSTHTPAPSVHAGPALRPRVAGRPRPRAEARGRGRRPSRPRATAARPAPVTPPPGPLRSDGGDDRSRRESPTAPPGTRAAGPRRPWSSLVRKRKAAGHEEIRRPHAPEDAVGTLERFSGGDTHDSGTSAPHVIHVIAALRPRRPRGPPPEIQGIRRTTS